MIRIWRWIKVRTIGIPVIVNGERIGTMRIGRRGYRVKMSGQTASNKGLNITGAVAHGYLPAIEAEEE